MDGTIGFSQREGSRECILHQLVQSPGSCIVESEWKQQVVKGKSRACGVVDKDLGSSSSSVTLSVRPRPSNCTSVDFDILL